MPMQSTRYLGSEVLGKHQQIDMYAQRSSLIKTTSIRTIFGTLSPHPSS